MLIDCNCCAMRATAACDDCVVTHLLGAGRPVHLAEDEEQALQRLAGAGLVPQLRLVPRRRAGPPPTANDEESAEAASG